MMPRKGDPAGVRVLGAVDVEALLTPRECIDAVEDAFRRWALGEVGDPAMLGVHLDGGAFHIKAGAMRVGNRNYFAAKTNGNFPGNPERRALPSIQGVIALSDGESGLPLAVIDSIRITELRTAAASAVAARHLARQGASHLTVIGCGAQARSQVRALNEVRRLSRVTLVDRDSVRAQRVSRWVKEELDVPVEAHTDIGAAIGACDMCVTCTTSTQPIVTADMVRPGTFVAAVGADSPAKQEIDSSLLARSKVVADSIDQCATIGDVHHAIAAGLMTRDDVFASLGEVVAGLEPGRETEDEIIVFDSTGTALQDVAAAALVYERAIAAGRGVQVDLAPPPTSSR
jgi:alanine dehydrogenase